MLKREADGFSATLKDVVTSLRLTLEAPEHPKQSNDNVPCAQPPAAAPVKPKKKKKKTCLICFEKIAAGTSFRLPCGHSGFHEACILDWLQRTPRCPLCDQHFPEYEKKETKEKKNKKRDSMHDLPLSEIYADPEWAQAMGVPVIYV